MKLKVIFLSVFIGISGTGLIAINNEKKFNKDRQDFTYIIAGFSGFLATLWAKDNVSRLVNKCIEWKQSFGLSLISDIVSRNKDSIIPSSLGVSLLSDLFVNNIKKNLQTECVKNDLKNAIKNKFEKRITFYSTIDAGVIKDNPEQLSIFTDFKILLGSLLLKIPCSKPLFACGIIAGTTLLVGGITHLVLKKLAESKEIDKQQA